eukprot:gnl/MRDRNA2_/MRDRNA2_114039_c0_seq1.p1 gnl/MRDRNA2_/MRDRNA2_114039_c0~~gnl/MRDRNA2_/MRDRNA2_114039_c0_seq1.p1  ORF type:complete len:174 (+),score=38.98 gnl/MRDRNA2_/MRDRNA2_114039_c0_seq1:56-523(+)
MAARGGYASQPTPLAQDVVMVDAAVANSEVEVAFRERLAQKRKAVDGHLALQKSSEAVHAALEDPPHGSQVPDTKAQTAHLVVKALSSAKDTELHTIVDSLSDQEQVFLMKYLYRGWELGLPARQNAQLFAWHASLVKTAGEGVVARAMFDSRWP